MRATAVRDGDIVVGYDGSPGGERALRWAAHEADLRGAQLTVVYVYDQRPHEVPQPGPTNVTAVDPFAGAVVAGAISTVRSVAPAVRVAGLPLVGQAAQALIDAAGRGATVVVGNRGRGGFRSLLLGSVSEQVATHAAASVVVVRGRPDAEGPIVVGVDGSAAADSALGVAIAEAHLRQAGVTAVCAYPKLDPTVVPMGPPYVVDAQDRREAVAAAIGRWRETYRDVKVEVHILEGGAAEILIDASAGAQLIVVGTRGHGGFAGLHLGSVGLALLHHAHCPVLVDRP
jgi:nucleotide-binding universal stress UspA family protein